MLSRLNRASTCAQCTRVVQRASTLAICPPAESSAQAARRYAGLHKLAQGIDCAHFQPSGAVRSFHTSAARRAAKVTEKDNGKAKFKSLDMEDFPRERIRYVLISSSPYLWA